MSDLSYLRFNDNSPLPDLLGSEELSEKYSYKVLCSFSNDEIRKLTLYDPNYRMAMGLSPNCPKSRWRQKLNIIHCIRWTNHWRKVGMSEKTKGNLYDPSVVLPSVADTAGNFILQTIVNAAELKKYNKRLKKQKENKK